MGFLSSLVAYLTVVAAFSGMMLATFFYLVSPSDPARTGAEAKRAAETKPAAIQQASPERGRTASRKTIASEAKTPAPAPSKTALPVVANPGEATASAPASASLAPADRTTGRGPSASERNLSLSERSAETPAASKPPKKVKKRAKRQPAIARRAPPSRPSYDQWNGRFAGPPERPYYERSPFQYDRGPYPYERGPFWYR